MAYTNETPPVVFERHDPNGNLFYCDSDTLIIPGLYYQANFLTEEEEKQILSIIDSNEWNHDIQRKTQYYGYTYYHTRHNSTSMQPTEQIENTHFPLSQLQFVIDKFKDTTIFPPDHPPTQILVNEYLRNMSIKGHVDNVDAFGDVIISLSLCGPAYMTMRSIENPNIVAKVFMEERSILIMSGDSRFKWRHAITKQRRVYLPTKKITILRDDTYRRVSLTIREIKIEGTKKVREGEEDCNRVY